MHKPTLAIAAAAALAVTACSEQRDASGLTADENEKLNTAAESLDNSIVDASPDSMVAQNDEWSAAESGEALANSPDANGQ